MKPGFHESTIYCYPFNLNILYYSIGSSSSLNNVIFALSAVILESKQLIYLYLQPQL
jgi:hypothetical protein